MSGFGLVDDVIKEPLGGAHSYPEKTADAVKKYIENDINKGLGCINIWKCWSHC